jgi:hypothetical protein
MGMWLRADDLRYWREGGGGGIIYLDCNLSNWHASMDILDPDNQERLSMEKPPSQAINQGPRDFSLDLTATVSTTRLEARMEGGKLYCLNSLH